MRNKSQYSFKKQSTRTIFLACLIIVSCRSSKSLSAETLKSRVQTTDGLVALWDFSEKTATERKAIGQSSFSLKEVNGPIERIAEGPLSGFSAYFDGTQYMTLPWEETKGLNLYGPQQVVTVMAWIKWSGNASSFIAGMWNEYQDGGKRQYGLFVSLPHYNGADQVCGHISKTGKPTPPFPYSIDYSASKQKVTAKKWVCVAFTYGGTYIRSYYNGRFEARRAEHIKHTKGFDGYEDGLIQSKNPYYFPDGMGDNGSDFTVGAVLLKSGMGNFYKGLIGGVAIFDRALDPSEMKRLAVVP